MSWNSTSTDLFPNATPTPTPGQVNTPGSNGGVFSFEQGLALATNLLTVADEQAGVQYEIERLERLLKRGYTGNGRNRRSINSQVVQKDIDNLQLRNNALQNDIDLFARRLQEDFGSTQVPHNLYSPEARVVPGSGGIGARALIDRARFNLDYVPIGGAVAVAGPEVVLGAAFAGFMRAGAAAAIEAALDEAVGLPVSYLRGRFGKSQTRAPNTVEPPAARPGSVSGNPANRLIDVPTKNGSIVRRYVRITAEDAQRYRNDLADRSVDLLTETPSKLTEEAARQWRHQRMNEFRREWLDDFYKNRSY